jgi:AcrR family transcriptional regulator
MPTVKSRREQYSDATKAALLEAATRRFADQGFAGTSLEDVATDVQATRGAVYHHFASKGALFQAVLEQLETDMVHRVAEAAATASNPWDAALAALDRFLDQCCDPVYGRVAWQEAPIALGWAQWKATELRFTYGFVEQTVKSLVESGDLPDLPLEPMARVTFHILGGAGMALAEAAGADKPRVRDEYATVIRHMLEGARVTLR